jgi:hypothetical protein
MPEIYIHKTEDVYIRVWEMEESEDFFISQLTGKLKDHSVALDKIKLPKNRLQYLASRLLIAEYFYKGEELQLYKLPTGKLMIQNISKQFSISHTNGFAAFSASNYRIGIDIEETDRDISILASKFMKESEQYIFSSPLDLLKVWCTKECVFKIIETGEVDFKDHIAVGKNADESLWVSSSLIKDNRQFPIYHHQIKKILIVWIFET